MTSDATPRLLTDRDEDTFGGAVVAAGSPATAIVLGYMALALVVGVVVGTILFTNPDLFGEQGYAGLAGLLVYALTILGLIRLAITYVVLRRTTYVVTPDSVRREYQLAFREQARELPLHMIRGVEVRRSRLQSLLGYATISFLAVGSNRGIGYVEFENAADPESLQTAVLERLEAQRDAAPDADTPVGTPARAPASSNAPDSKADEASEPTSTFGRTEPIGDSPDHTDAETAAADGTTTADAGATASDEGGGTQDDRGGDTIFSDDPADAEPDDAGGNDRAAGSGDGATDDGDPLGEDSEQGTANPRRPVSGTDRSREHPDEDTPDE